MTTQAAHTNGTADAQNQAWLDAVDAVVARARKYYGTSFNHRITKARHFILNGQIEYHGQYALIQSESHPETLYRVDHDECDCQDAQYTAPQGLCAHRFAWDIARKAWHDTRQQWQRSPEPIPNPYTDPAPSLVEPLAEAPISISMKGTLAGVAGTLVTIRGRNMDEIAARAAAIKAGAGCLAGMFDETANVATSDEGEGDEEAAASGDEPIDIPPICKDHGTEMKRSKFGGWFCPQRIDDDEFCPQKVKGKKQRRRRG